MTPIPSTYSSLALNRGTRSSALTNDRAVPCKTAAHHYFSQQSMICPVCEVCPNNMPHESSSLHSNLVNRLQQQSTAVTPRIVSPPPHNPRLRALFDIEIDLAGLRGGSVHALLPPSARRPPTPYPNQNDIASATETTRSVSACLNRKVGGFGSTGFNGAVHKLKTWLHHTTERISTKSINSHKRRVGFVVEVLPQYETPEQRE